MAKDETDKCDLFELSEFYVLAHRLSSAKYLSCLIRVSFFSSSDHEPLKSPNEYLSQIGTTSWAQGTPSRYTPAFPESTTTSSTMLRVLCVLMSSLWQKDCGRVRRGKWQGGCHHLTVDMYVSCLSHHFHDQNSDIIIATSMNYRSPPPIIVLSLLTCQDDEVLS
jgi:hypothetical protein